MISWGDVYNVTAPMTPLYLASALGYGSVKWWSLITFQTCDSINKLVYYFALPFFLLDFISRINPFSLNYKYIAADVVSKGIIVILLTFWANISKNGSCDWSITMFSLATVNNTLILGVPLLRAMYGDEGVYLVLQSAIVQFLVWITVLMFVYEVRESRNGLSAEKGGLEMENQIDEVELAGVKKADVKPSIWVLLKIVCVKVATNPNCYACFIGLIWALISNWLNIKMPIIVKGSINIMSQSALGTAMFSLGIFMGLQKKILSCGVAYTILGMVLRFIVGPASIAIGGFALGLHGDVFRIAIIQAALPLGISSFILGKEYDLHAEVLSTGVIFGTIMSLPILIGYYAVLEVIR